MLGEKRLRSMEVVSEESCLDQDQKGEVWGVGHSGQT